MARREGAFRHEVVDLSVGLVLTLALLVLHNAALQVQRLLVEGTKQVAHAVGFDEERIVQRRYGHGLEVVGPIVVGCAIEIGCANLFERVDDPRLDVLAAAEHQVLEQMGESGLAVFLVL